MHLDLQKTLLSQTPLKLILLLEREVYFNIGFRFDGTDDISRRFALPILK